MGQIIQVAELSQRDRTAGWVSSVITKSGRLKLADNINGQYRFIFNQCDVFGKEIETAKETQNKGYYAIQGHPRSSRSVPIESPYTTSY